MVKLNSFLVLSTIIIAPAFGSELWDIEIRDLTEPYFFGRDAEATVCPRDIEGLFARQRDFEHPDLVRRFDFNWDRITNACKAAKKMGFRALFGPTKQEKSGSSQDNAQEFLEHPPPSKHELVDRGLDDDEVLERNLDRELYIRDLTDDELFERFYNDLD